MLLELLNTPERRATILPELVKFFRKRGGDEWRNMAEAFCRTFSGMQFTMPGPEYFVLLDRDAKIVEQLKANLSAESRLAILRANRINYSYLTNLWFAAMDRPLAPPTTTNKQEAIELAGALIAKYPLATTDIIIMFGLDANERALAVEASRKLRRDGSSRLTQPQTRALHLVKHRGGKTTTGDLRTKLGKTAPWTVASLKRAGMIEVNGETVSLTIKGAAKVAK